MPEMLGRSLAPGVERGLAVAERLSREVAIMGNRLATLLERSPVVRDGGLEQGHSFLTAMFRSAVTGASLVDAEERPDRPGDAEPHPIDQLADGLALTRMDLDLVVLAGMAEEHEGYASILRSLNPRGEPHATTGLAAQVGCENPRDRIALRRTLETGSAARSGIIVLTGDAPFFEKNILLADGLWAVLCGLDSYPASLRPLQFAAASSGLDQWLASSGLDAARRAIEVGAPCVMVVAGDTETVALHRAAALVSACGRRWAAFEIGPATVSGASRLGLVHAAARGAVPIFKLLGSDASSAPLPEFESCPGLVIVCARRGAIEVGGRLPVITVDVAALTASARERMWCDTLPELAQHASTLASRYALEPSAAADVTTDLRARPKVNGSAHDLALVAECVRVRSNVPLAAGVRMVRPAASWEQLVLPADRKALLVEALNRLIHQGTVLDRWRFLDGRAGARGVRLLLSGPPGTGKTLSAEVMANSLGVDLMVVDISRVVSKWIGETEKHLAQVFDAAERAQAVLLFDEADALFGKRTEVSDAHDRYANLETAYLLSRLERFEGLTILSTNLKQNIDPAFLRRVEFAIEFDEPAAAERRALWRCHLPPEAPLAADVDLDELAGLYPIVGGLIRNASVAAGFLAAAADTAIGQRHLVGAIRREYEKSAKAFPGTPVGIVPV